MERVNIGMIGSGFASELHARAYRRVYGYDVNLAAVASLDPGADAFAKRYAFGRVTDDYRALLDDPAIDVIDIITPPYLHARMVKEALASGKHVVCEKPLTGYFGAEGDEEPIGLAVPKSRMYEAALRELDSLEAAVRAAEGTFMYAENFIYMPCLLKCEELLAAKRSKILFQRLEESHSGSHAAHAANWRYAGGGSLIRLGCHPLSAALYLKYREAAFRGEEIRVQSVLADTGVCAAGLTAGERAHIQARPVDVEDIAVVTLAFSDGTKAVVTASDVTLGGVRNMVEMYTNDGVYTCNAAPNNAMMVYHADGAGLGDVYITEKEESKTGWQSVYLDEEAARGYVGEMQDFVECAATGRAPKSDFAIARDTLKAIYAAYVSAEEGRRIAL